MEYLPLRQTQLPAAEELLPYLRQIDANRWYSNFGPLVLEFERRLAAHFGCEPNQLTTISNATAGLEMALMTIPPAQEKKCLMPSLTFLASPAAALIAGLEPFFVDIDRATWQMTPDLARMAIKDAGGLGAIGAVMPVSTYGAPVDVDAWSAFQEETGVPVIIDAAWCFDSSRIGPALQCISLHATKVFGVGEGGVILERDPLRVTAIRQMSNFGIRPDRSVAVSGMNAKMNEYCAAIGLAALDSWPERRRRTLELQSWYAAALQGVQGLDVLVGSGSTWASGTVAVLTEQPLQAALAARSQERKVDIRYWWNRPCHEQPVYAHYPRSALPATDWVRRRLVNLPFFVGMTENDVDRVVSVLRDTIG